jgi:FkbM family methyltransferase
VLRRLARPGDVAVDIGAHVGLHTLVLADAVGPAGRVVAFEPNPPTVARLRRNVELNDFEGRVEIHAVAASSASGMAELSLSDDAHNSGGASLAGQRVPTRSVAVPRAPLDDVVSADLAARVAVVKVDVEGHEADAFAGAARVLSSSPAVVFECNTAAAVEHLDRLGYRLFVVPAVGAPLAPFDAGRGPVRRAGAPALDLVAVRPGTAAWDRLQP